MVKMADVVMTVMNLWNPKQGRIFDRVREDDLRCCQAIIGGCGIASSMPWGPIPWKETLDDIYVLEFITLLFYLRLVEKETLD
jgi:hypothetical protein